MRKSALFVLLLSIAAMLGGCELIAAGVIGAEIEKQHRHWCYYHPGRC